MRDKIVCLVETTEKDFPNGCFGVACSNCPLDGAECNTLEWYLCGALHDGMPRT